MAEIITDKEGKVYILGTAGDKKDIPESLTVKEVRSKYTDLTGAIPLLKVKYRQYVRRLVVEDRISAVKIGIKGSVKWYLLKTSIARYVRERSRTVGIRSYKLRIPEEYEGGLRTAIAAYAKEKGFKFTFEKAYKGSSK
jgi:hypothetical protein